MVVVAFSASVGAPKEVASVGGDGGIATTKIVDEVA
jgi:hypothetical protein